MPEALRLAVSDIAPEWTRSEVSAAGRGFETRAGLAATAEAWRQIESHGRREVYRAGFSDGLRSALGDPELGSWDFDLGLRRGRSALAAVPESGTVEIRPAMGQERLEPRLRDVFRDHPPIAVVGGEGVESLPDPWLLYTSTDYEDVYDRRWAESGHAFEGWRERHRDAAFWQAMNRGEREYFEGVFRRAFSFQLMQLFAGEGELAFGSGFSDGWDYGALVAYEWNYRRGLHEGTVAAARRTVRAASKEPARRSGGDPVDLLRELALGERVAVPDEVERAQGGLLRRLELDWRDAVRRAANPFKDDFELGSRTTALGQLVAVYKTHRGRIERQDVISELVPRIEALADSMPGYHPFLRHYVKKLGWQLRS